MTHKSSRKITKDQFVRRASDGDENQGVVRRPADALDAAFDEARGLLRCAARLRHVLTRVERRPHDVRRRAHLELCQDGLLADIERVGDRFDEHAEAADAVVRALPLTITPNGIELVFDARAKAFTALCSRFAIQLLPAVTATQAVEVATAWRLARHELCAIERETKTAISTVIAAHRITQDALDGARSST